MENAFQDKLAAVVEQLKNARNILFITGAGISAESGLPTYRGISGLYENMETEDNMPIEEALSGQMLLRRPQIAWKYLSQIERACRDAQHNRAHEIIARMEQHFDRLLVLTQNVDGFHRSAGSSNIIDIHGTFSRLTCLGCRHEIRDAAYEALPLPPKCPQCSTAMRPDVVLFGEYLPSDKTARLQEELRRGFDMIFSIGTSSVFPYISGPVINAAMSGIPTVEINPGQTEVSNMVRYKFSERAVRVMEAIWEQLDGDQREE